MLEIDLETIIIKLTTDINSFRMVLNLPFPLKDVYRLQNLPGIYFVAISGKEPVICSLDQIIYIGVSSDIKARWSSHHKMPAFKKLEQSLSAYRLCDGGNYIKIYPWYNPLVHINHLKEIESQLIQIIKPVFNEKMRLTTIKPSSVANDQT